jgi:hypothetical protein
MYLSRMAGHCGLNAWQQNSELIHATSEGVCVTTGLFSFVIFSVRAWYAKRYHGLPRQARDKRCQDRLGTNVAKTGSGQTLPRQARDKRKETNL